MAKHEDISIGEKDVILEVISFTTKKPVFREFDWSDIVSVRVEKGIKTSFPFIKKPFEQIIVQTTNPPTPEYKMPIVIDKQKLGERFEEIVQTFKEYSKQRSFKYADKR